MRTIQWAVACMAVMVAAAGQVKAGIMSQASSRSSGTVSRYEDFDSGGIPDPPGQSFSTNTGFTFKASDGAFKIVPGNGGVGFSSNSLYQEEEPRSMSSISLTSGADIQHIEFDIGNGYGPADPQNIWVRAYSNGSAITSFIFNVPAPTTISVWSDGAIAFDEVRVQSYGPFGVDKSESQSGRVSIDNVTLFGPAPVPEPTSLVIFGFVTCVAGVGARRRRREKQQEATA